MLQYKKGRWTLLLCIMAAISVPAWCKTKNQPAKPTPPQAATTTSPSPQKEPTKKQIKEQTLARLQQAAQQGDKTAQLELGLVYGNGDDLKQDFDKAGYWLLKAAKQGEQPAVTFLHQHPLKNNQEIINSSVDPDLISSLASASTATGFSALATSARPNLPEINDGF